MFLEAIEKAGINGIVTGGATAGLFGMNARVLAPFMNQTVPLYVITFLGGAGASLVADGLHLFMKEEIPISTKANDQVSQLTSMAVSGAVLVSVLQMYSPNVARDFGYLYAFLLGAGSEWVGSASYTQLKEKMYI